MGTEAKHLGKQSRNSALDGIRALSAVGIVLMHVHANGGYGMTGFLFEQMIPSLTNLVFLFMIVSGYSMCCGYYQKIMENRVSWGEFYGRRIRKIWPFFAFWSGVELVLSPSKTALYEVFANLTLCFGLLPNADISVIGVGWFIGLVFVFYLVFPFFCYLLSDKKRAWLSFGVALIFNYLCTVRFHADRTNIVYSAVFFLTGGLLFLYREQLQRLARKCKWAVLLAIVAMCCVYYLFGGYVPVMLVLFSLMVVYTMDSQGRYWILSNRVTGFLGGISLEIYLCHMVAFRLLEKIGLQRFIPSQLLAFAVMAAATLVGSIVLSVAVKKALQLTGSLLSRLFSEKDLKTKAKCDE